MEKEKEIKGSGGSGGDMTKKKKLEGKGKRGKRFWFQIPARRKA